MTATRILFVEHDRFFNRDWFGFLEKMGYELHCCSSREDILSKIHELSIDLLLVSHHLPEVNGIEIFREVRAQDPDPVGILVLEEMNLNLVVQAMNNGFSRVVPKSVGDAELIQLVEELMDVARLREENTRLKTLLPLFNLGRKFLVATSVESIYQELVDVVAREIQAPIISLMIFDKQSNRLKIVASRGLKYDVVEEFTVRPGEKISGKVFEIGKPVILNKQTQDQTPFSEMLNRNELAASISFPLISREEVIGVLNISQTKDGVQYSQADLEMLSVITSQAVMALEKLNYIEEHEKNIWTRALLEQYMAPEVADLLVRKKQNVMEVGGVHDITVLYADIRNFTKLVQKLHLNELRIFLNEFFELLSDMVFSWKGTLDKFIGDAVLVVFGAPLKLETPSVSAVFAARQILRQFDKLCGKWSEISPVFSEIGLGIGISRGEMFLGNVGSNRRFDYTVIGADVNLAQRLASKAESGQILIAEAVRRDVGDLLAVKEEQPRFLKGIEKKIRIYSLGSIQKKM